MNRPLRAPRRLRPGFTLIELLVVVVIASIFIIAVLAIQASLSRQNTRVGDVGNRDNQVGTALDLLGADLSNAGFMSGDVTQACTAVLAYDSALSPAAFIQYPVYSAPQPASLPTSSSLPSGTPSATSYPPTGSGIVTQMVAINGAATAIQPSSGGNATLYVVQNITATMQGGAGSVSSTELPLSVTTGIAVGDATLLRIVDGGSNLCFRVPVTQIGIGGTPQQTYIASTGSTLFPTSGYSGFQTLITGLGLGTLTNSNLILGRLSDPGAQSSSVDQTVVYYIGAYSNGSGGTYPVLMRAVISGADDTLANVPGESNPSAVAAGVVSLQALYGVDETNSGAVTNYLSWPDVTSGGYAADVRSVLFAVVARTLHGDPSYQAPASIAVQSPAGAGNDTFSAYTPQSGEAHDRFSVVESEVAVRNQLWAR